MRTAIFKRGMTLVELLVAVSIMVVLVGLSVPLFKPMLTSQRAGGGARAVAMVLQRARVKAMETAKPVGVEFERYDLSKAADLNNADPNQNLCLRMHFMKDDDNLSNQVVVSGMSIRLRIVNGVIEFWGLTPGATDYVRITNSVPHSDALKEVEAVWNPLATPGTKILLSNRGEFRLDSSTKLAAPYDKINLPELDAANAGSFLEFTLRRPPRRILTAPVVMPRGTVIDLAFSGIGQPNNNFGYYMRNGRRLNRNIYNKVVVMFSPAGYVDKVYYSKFVPDTATPNDLSKDVRQWTGPVIPNELIYFCVGEWDRQTIDYTGGNLAEDGKNNLDTMSNFWVTANPKTGEIRTAPMAVTTKTKLEEKLPEARKFATQYYVNVGE